MSKGGCPGTIGPVFIRIAVIRDLWISVTNKMTLDAKVAEIVVFQFFWFEAEIAQSPCCWGGGANTAKSFSGAIGFENFEKIRLPGGLATTMHFRKRLHLRNRRTERLGAAEGAKCFLPWEGAGTGQTKDGQQPPALPKEGCATNLARGNRSLRNWKSGGWIEILWVSQELKLSR